VIGCSSDARGQVRSKRRDHDLEDHRLCKSPPRHRHRTPLQVAKSGGALFPGEIEVSRFLNTEQIIAGLHDVARAPWSCDGWSLTRAFPRRRLTHDGFPVLILFAHGNDRHLSTVQLGVPRHGWDGVTVSA